MHRARFAHLRRGPRNRTVQRPVDLQRGGPQTVAAQCTRIARRQPLAGQRRKRAGHQVRDQDRRSDALASIYLNSNRAAVLDDDARDVRAGAHLAPQLAQV